MKNFNYIKSLLCLAVMALALTGCEEDLESPVSDFVGFEIGPASRALAVAKDATESFDIKVYATETKSSNRSFNVLVDMDATSLASPFSVPSQVTIPGGSNEGTLSISITDNDDLGFVAQDLKISLEGFPGNELAFSVTEACLDTIVTFNLTLDTWPNETTWEVYDLSVTPAVVIFSGGPYNNTDDADDNAELSFDFCLASGDYGVVVYDSYGDGGPTYSVVTAAGTLVADTTLGGSQSSSTFTVD